MILQRIRALTAPGQHKHCGLDGGGTQKDRDGNEGAKLPSICGRPVLTILEARGLKKKHGAATRPVWESAENKSAVTR